MDGALDNDRVRLILHLDASNPVVVDVILLKNTLKKKKKNSIDARMKILHMYVISLVGSY